MQENTTPGTEFPRIFCYGIGPLQFGVVLVLLLVVTEYMGNVLSVSKYVLK